MSQETPKKEKPKKERPKGDLRQRTEWGSHSQTHEPWKGNPEKGVAAERSQARSGEMAREQYSLTGAPPIDVSVVLRGVRDDSLSL